MCLECYRVTIKKWCETKIFFSLSDPKINFIVLGWLVADLKFQTTLMFFFGVKSKKFKFYF